MDNQPKEVSLLPSDHSLNLVVQATSREGKIPKHLDTLRKKTKAYYTLSMKSNENGRREPHRSKMLPPPQTSTGRFRFRAKPDAEFMTLDAGPSTSDSGALLSQARLTKRSIKTSSTQRGAFQSSTNVGSSEQTQRR